MIDDVLVRWVVTVLFAVSATLSTAALVRDRRRATAVVCHVAHVAMAVAMVAMAWPAGAAWPTGGPALFFAVATAWFVGQVLVRRGHRGRAAYHAVMMLAMVWMYAVMGGDLSPTPADGVASVMGGGGHHGGGGMGHAATASHEGAPPLVVGVNALWTVVFAAAALWSVSVPFVRRGAEPSVASPRAVVTDLTMAAGMAAAFLVMV